MFVEIAHPVAPIEFNKIIDSIFIYLSSIKNIRVSWKESAVSQKVHRPRKMGYFLSGPNFIKSPAIWFTIFLYMIRVLRLCWNLTRHTHRSVFSKTIFKFDICTCRWFTKMKFCETIILTRHPKRHISFPAFV